MRSIPDCPDPGGSPEDVFLANLPMIDALIQIVARRHRLSRPDAEEFASIVRLRLIENDYSIIRQFRGGSSLRTFLAVVIARQCLDYRVSCWGRWRPSAVARRLGATAVSLERLMIRDGLTVEEAWSTLRTGDAGITLDELRALAEHLRARVKRRLVQLSNLDEVSAPPENPAPLYQTRDGRPVLAALARGLRTLEPADRRLLKLRFSNGLTVSEIARREGLEQSLLYRRVDRLLRCLRRQLESSGVSAEDCGGQELA
jgi:RNA polymerase sigma factor (sigma-70 family)